MTLTLYTAAVSVHVIIAVLVVGTAGAVPVIASAGLRDAASASAARAILPPVLRVSLVGLLLLLTTGIAVEAIGGAVFHDTGWFRLSVLLLVVSGALHAFTRRALRQEDTFAAVRAVRQRSIALCIVLAVVVGLMEAKPF